MVKYLKGKNAPINDIEGDLNVESDCEGDSTGVVAETQKLKEEKKETRAVLITGSFSAYVHSLTLYCRRNDEFRSWKSLFFYRCTDAILFAPLKSQDANSRSKYVRENTVTDIPPPCSPKSIYVLASLVSHLQPSVSRATLTHRSKLGIEPLCDSAFADIKNKVSLDNVVDEVFSWITAGWALLFSPTVDWRSPANVFVQS